MLAEQDGCGAGENPFADAAKVGDTDNEVAVVIEQFDVAGEDIFEIVKVFDESHGHDGVEAGEVGEVAEEITEMDVDVEVEFVEVFVGFFDADFGIFDDVGLVAFFLDEVGHDGAWGAADFYDGEIFVGEVLVEGVHKSL